LKRRLLILVLPLVMLVALAVLAWLGPHAYRYLRTRIYRFEKLGEWFDHPASHPDWTVQAGTRCGQAPFLLPTNGYIGFLWDDSFQLLRRHQGLDVFGGEQVGQTPVVAAYSGYLTRLSDWKSTLAIRVPQDPLEPGRSIWMYYTHLASANGESYIVPEFAPGVENIFVEAGTLLGWQGNYSGEPSNPTGIHLHFSIVLDDGSGWMRGELDIRNTLDPTPYLGIAVNANHNRGEVPVCEK